MWFKNKKSALINLRQKIFTIEKSVTSLSRFKQIRIAALMCFFKWANFGYKLILVDR